MGLILFYCYFGSCSPERIQSPKWCFFPFTSGQAGKSGPGYQVPAPGVAAAERTPSPALLAQGGADFSLCHPNNTQRFGEMFPDPKIGVFTHVSTWLAAFFPLCYPLTPNLSGLSNSTHLISDNALQVEWPTTHPQ